MVYLWIVAQTVESLHGMKNTCVRLDVSCVNWQLVMLDLLYATSYNQICNAQSPSMQHVLRETNDIRILLRQHCH